MLSPEQLVRQEQALESLAELVACKEAILLVGSGCSRPMLPSWGELVEELVRVADDCVDDGYTLPDDLEDKWDKFQHIHNAVKEHQKERCLERFRQRLVQIFHLNDASPGRVHEILTELPFRGYLTTNYDRLLERGLGEYDGDRALDIQTAVPILVGRGIRAITNPGKPEEVIHLHGTGERPEGMVLTTSDYMRAYEFGGRSSPHRTHARTLLSALLMTRQVVFVGFGLTDPFLMRVVRGVTEDWWEWDFPVHYAIMPIWEEHAPEQWEASNRFRKDYGIQVLFYEAWDDDHSGLTGTLERLSARVAVRVTRVEDERPVRLTPSAAGRPDGHRKESSFSFPESALEQLSRERIGRNLGFVEEGDDED